MRPWAPGERNFSGKEEQGGHSCLEKGEMLAKQSGVPLQFLSQTTASRWGHREGDMERVKMPQTLRIRDCFV